MRRVALLVVLAAIPTGCISGVRSVCTEIGCTDGLVVQVTPSAPWPPGEYRFVVEADGVTTTCTGTLPLPACDTRAITCDREGVVSIGESGCALPPSDHAFGELRLTSTPESIAVRVQLDGDTIGEQTFTPTYRTSQPNGPDCEPTCTNADVTLALSFE